MTDHEDEDRTRALAQPARARGRQKPPPPTFEEPAPPAGSQAIGRVPVRRVPASSVQPPQGPPSTSPKGPRERSPQPPPARPKREAPERPPTSSVNAAPVLTKLPPPFTVRLSQFLWVLSLLTGGVGVVYLFVIREDQLPLIIEGIKGVAEGRSDETYTAAADIVFWSIFGIAVALLLIQIVLLVSFSNRKPNVRWWQLATVVGQIVLFLLSLEFLASGEHGPVLRQVLLAQWSLALLALLFSTFRNALQWTARGHDIRRAGGGEGPEF